MKVLVTTKDYFFASDGKQYRAAFGETPCEGGVDAITITTSLGDIAFNKKEIVAVQACLSMPPTDNVLQ